MTTAISICAILGLALSSIAARLLFARLRVLPTAAPPDPADPADPDDAPRISLIIPARNEAANLDKLLPALGRQAFPPHEVIVVDDQSDDATAEVARGHGARVLAGRPLPDGWFGKPWACRQGADAASGDWFLFLDADLEPAPDALTRLAALTRGEPAVFSVCPHHRVPTATEQLSMFFNLLMVAGIGAFTWKGDAARGIGLFGQTLLVSRRHYDQVGGHDTVRRTVLENFKLSREFDRLGIPRRCFLGGRALAMRMFPGGHDELVAGWSKGFSAGAGLSSRLALALSSAWLGGLMLVTMPIVAGLLLGVLPPALALLGYLGAVVQLAILVPRVGSFSLGSVLLFPVPLFFYQFIFARSIVRKRRGGGFHWKGRDVSDPA